MNILTPAPHLGSTLLTLLNQQPNLEQFAQQHEIDRNWLLTLHGDLRRGHQPTIMQGELEALARALGETALLRRPATALPSAQTHCSILLP